MFQKVQANSGKRYCCAMSHHPAPGTAPRSREAMIAAASRVLAREPASSLAEVATALGVGRTTLHRMFPTRTDLLRAIAEDALTELSRAYTEAGFGPDEPPEDVLGGVRRVVEHLIPRGAALLFLLRVPELADDADLARRTGELDQPLHDALARDVGVLRADVPSWWAVEMLLAAVYVAWEQIEAGRLAPLDAPDLVMRTWLAGVTTSR